MRRSREEIERLKAEVMDKLPKEPPTPLYQKVVLLVFFLVSLFGLLAILLSR